MEEEIVPHLVWDCDQFLLEKIDSGVGKQGDHVDFRKLLKFIKSNRMELLDPEGVLGTGNQSWSEPAPTTNF